MFKNNKIRNKLFFLFFVSFSGIYSQISFEASVSKKKLGINERLKITFEISRFNPFSIPSLSIFQYMIKYWASGIVTAISLDKIAHKKNDWDIINNFNSFFLIKWIMYIREER